MLKIFQGLNRLGNDLTQFADQLFGGSVGCGIEFCLSVSGVLLLWDAVDDPLIQVSGKVPYQDTNRILIASGLPPNLVG